MIYYDFLTIDISHYIILYAAELELILGGSLLADHVVTQTTWQLGGIILKVSAPKSNG